MAAAAVPTVPTIPSRESAATKARRIVMEGRLVIVRCAPGMVEATCRGEGAVHHLGYSHGAWHCTCESYGNACSHIRACKLVVAVDL